MRSIPKQGDAARRASSTPGNAGKVGAEQNSPALHTRSYFCTRLQQLIDTRATSNRFAVLMVELDSMQRISILHGQAEAKRIYEKVVNRLVKVIAGSSGVLTRISTDRFALLVNHLSTAEDASTFAGLLAHLIEKPIHHRGHTLCLSACTGFVYGSTEESALAEGMLSDATIALERARAGGRSGYVHFREEMRKEIFDRFELENDLRFAVQEGHLYLVYQPKVEISTGRITGFEALVRWKHPKTGDISPATFIPMAEEIGLIATIGRFVTIEAIAQLGRWRQEGLVDDSITMAINLSPEQLHTLGFLESLQVELRKAGLPNECLILEVTESALLADVPPVAAELRRLHDAGIGLDLDDFGTGYSSLSYLHRFPFRSIKIDRSFVARMNEAETSSQLVTAIISIAKCFNMQVIAEGVETSDQAQTLCDLGCEVAQGYHFFRPMPLTELNTLLRSPHANSMQPAYC